MKNTNNYLIKILRDNSIKDQLDSHNHGKTKWLGYIVKRKKISLEESNCYGI